MEPRSLAIHDGSFHADEVSACALLLLFDKIDRERIYRTRDPNLLKLCEYVCDVGGVYDPKSKRFDHHQPEYQGTMSSAGMVLLFLKETKEISPHLYEHFNQTLILGVDAHDNGLMKLEMGTTSFSLVISNFLPIQHSASKQELDQAFLEAVEFALGHLDRLQKRYFYALECREMVQKAMEKGEYALVFDQAIPWLESFFDLGGELHPAQFVVMPTGDHWKLRCIPPSLDQRMKVRKALPESWAGLRDQGLSQVSQVPGAIFCHKGRFISIWQTKEDAIKALHKVLE